MRVAKKYMLQLQKNIKHEYYSKNAEYVIPTCTGDIKLQTNDHISDAIFASLC